MFILIIDYCPTLLDPTNGIVSFSMMANDNNSYQLDTIATHECNDGFDLVGNSTRTCVDGDASGTAVWSRMEPTCESKASLSISNKQTKL